MLDRLATTEIERESKRVLREFTKFSNRRIGVHVISEFVHCPRAGIIAAESKNDDSGGDFYPAPALGGLPSHDVDEIERGIEEVDERILVPMIWLTSMLLATPVFYGISWKLAIGPGFGLLVWLFQVIHLVRIRIVLSYRLRSAMCALSAEPDWHDNVIQKVNWWQLIRAGFVSREKREPLVDPATGLVGNPWRVLHRGVWQLPVIRIEIPRERIRDKVDRLTLPQYARIAAYAYLIFRTERLLSPWAIVLFNKGYEGIAVPIRSNSWDAFRKGVALARQHLNEYHHNVRYTPSPPAKRACEFCRKGQPAKLHSITILNGKTYEPFTTTCRRNIAFHSTCGDRFHWVPPHKDSATLGLRDR